jgi:hypothetical protein
MPALLHSIAEGLRTGAPTARVDCAEVLAEAAALRPDLLGDFVTDFLDASKSANKTVAKLGFLGLTRITAARAAEVYAEREYLLEAAKKNDPLGLAAAAVLAALCGHNPNYRGKLIGNVVRLLVAIPDKDLPKWIATVGPAVEGSADAYKRLELALQPRRATLPADVAAKVDKAMVKLERSTAKR